MIPEGQYASNDFKGLNGLIFIPKVENTLKLRSMTDIVFARLGVTNVQMSWLAQVRCVDWIGTRECSLLVCKREAIDSTRVGTNGSSKFAATGLISMPLTGRPF